MAQVLLLSVLPVLLCPASAFRIPPFPSTTPRSYYPLGQCYLGTCLPSDAGGTATVKAPRASGDGSVVDLSGEEPYDEQEYPLEYTEYVFQYEDDSFFLIKCCLEKS